MSGFSIDDVRDSFQTDVSSRIQRIEAAAKVVLRLPESLAVGHDPVGRMPFDGVAQDGHAIFGSSSLVSAGSLATTAATLESLAKTGREALRIAEFHLKKARRIADVCVEGSIAMTSMLELELQHRTADAMHLTEALQEFADSVAREELAAARSSLEPPPGADTFEFGAGSGDVFAFGPGTEPPGEEEFSFDETGGVSAAESVQPHVVEPHTPVAQTMGAARIQDELVEVFQIEARESLVALHGHLEALYRNAMDSRAMEHIERIYHKLKGASATVGLKEVSTLAAKLQNRAEEVVEGEVVSSPDFVNTLIEDTNKLLGMASLPLITITGEKKEERTAAEKSAEERQVFLSEAQEIVEEASTLTRRLALAAPDRALMLAGDLARLFHRLKGSAVISGAETLSRLAGELEALCERQGGVSATELQGRLQQLASEVGVTLEAPQAPLTAHQLVREPVKIPDRDLWEAFQTECGELLDGIDRSILELETTTQPRKALEDLLRQVHTLKGAINAVGIAPTGKILHRVEDFLEHLIDAKVLPRATAIAGLLLDVQRGVRHNLRQAISGSVETSMARLEAQINAVQSGGRLPEEPMVRAGGTAASLAVVAHPSGTSLRSASVVSHERSVLTHDASRGSSRKEQEDSRDERKDKFVRVPAERLDVLMNLAGELVVSRSRLLTRVNALKNLQFSLAHTGRALIERVEAFREQHEFTIIDASKVDAQQTREGKSNGKNGNVHADAAAGAAIAKQSDVSEQKAWSSFSALELDRYDDVNLLARGLAETSNDVGELQAQLLRELGALAEDSDSFSSIASGIQGEVTRARMVPVEYLFTRLHLPTRDAAERERKDVRLVIEGQDVNLDKAIAEALVGPMLHLVRNAVVHGIESADVRRRRNKSSTGAITLAARQESGQIILEVRDDGGGLDVQRLHAAGVAQGLIDRDVPVNDPVVRDLVFASGLSTKEDTGAVAGRGVGCDVVRRAVERLNGVIRVETTAGVGTSFIINLPMTLAITRALLVRHRDALYAIPVFFVDRIIEAGESAVVESLGVRRISVRGSYVVVLDLPELFGTLPGPREEAHPLVMLQMGERSVALEVDAVLSSEEIVVKSPGDILSGHPLFAGVTIRGDGNLVMILDIAGMMEDLASRNRGRRGPIHVPQARIEERSLSESTPEVSGAESMAEATSASAISGAEIAVEHVPRVAAESVPRKLRVLFVDDSLSVRKVAERELVGLGVDVTVAVDGIDALEKLRSHSFDAVFTDLEMPRMHGYELIRELRFVPQFKNIPIVVVSSRSGQKHQDEARSLGATDYLTKPFTGEMLQGALNRWVRKKGD